MTRVRLHRLFAWLLLPMIGGAPAASRGQPAADESPADPFPLRRIVIPAERVPAELQRQGTLVQMPRAEFESKVRQAAQAQQALRQQPRIVKAIYSAEFSGQSLTGGSGQWSVHHAGAGPGILPIAQLNLALDKIKVANVDGVLGDLDGKNLGLWIEQPGVHSVYFDWSLQGQARADGVAFAMRVPACLTNVLELKLPADHAVFVESHLGLAAGPFDTERAAQKLWRIQTTGRSQIDFAVRKSEARASKSLVFTSLESRQELLSAAVHADFDVEIQAIPSASTELIFDHDARLHPYEVTVRQADLKDWELMPAAPMTGHAALAVRLREPRQGALQVRIRCLASRTPNQAWICPGLRLRQAIPRGESLQIVVPSAQPVDHWEPGQFHLTRTGIDKNGNQILTLVDLDPEAATPRRPHLTLAPLAGEWNVRQHTRLSVAAAATTLVADLTYTARRGPQHELALQLPPGPWRVDDVAWEPKDALRSWTVAGGQVLVELNRALDPHSPGKMTLRLRMPGGRDDSGSRILPIPEPSPIGASHRQCSYAIHVDPAIQASLLKSSATPATPDVETLGQDLPPSFYFSYRDAPLIGLLRLQGPRTLLSARIEQQAILDSAAACTARLAIDPIAGQPSYADLYFSTPINRPWQVMPTQGAPAAQLERRLGPETTAPLLALGARPGFERLLTWAHLPTGESWRLRWHAPLTQRTTFLLRGPLHSTAGDPHDKRAICWLPNFILPLPLGAALFADCRPISRWEIPVLSVSNGGADAGEVSIQAPGLEVVRDAAHVLQRSGEVKSSRGGAYHWLGQSFAHSLTLWTRPNPAPADTAPVFDHAQLTSYVGVDGGILHHFRFQAIRWLKARLPVLLPKTATQVRAARLDGQWLERLSQDRAAESIALELPMPLDGSAHWFDVWFASESQTSFSPPAFQTFGHEPELPAAPLRKRRVWRLAAGLLPLHQERMAGLDRGAASAAARLRAGWHSADGLVESMFPDALDDWRETQRHAVSSAEIALRRPGTLGEALQRFVLEGLQEQMALIVDKAALREAGFDPQTNVGSVSGGAAGKGFWEALGLTYVPAPAAPLLTTRRRWLDWQQGQALPERLDEALAQAVAHGQDALGKFCRADIWLRTETALRIERTPAPFPVTDWIGRNWTEWEPVFGAADAASLVVVDVSAVRVLGLIGGALLLLPLAAVRRRLSSAGRLRLAILLLVADLCSIVSLPVTLAELAIWPAIVLAVGLALEYPQFLASTRGKKTRKTPSTHRPSAAAASVVALLALFIGSWCAQGQNSAPAPATVYFTDAGPDRSLALASPELLKRLDDLRQRGMQPAQGAVLTSAQYQGKAQNATSDFQAHFDIYSFSEEATVVAPLAGVDLKPGAFLDGAPVYPTAAPGQGGYSVPVKGKGWHRLTLGFTARHQPAGKFRELRCTIPALSRSQVVWQAPASWISVSADRASGETRQTLDSAKQVQEIRSQYGRDGELLLRWQTMSANSVTAEPELREHYYWNFDTPAPSLAAVLDYESAAGNRTQLELAMPEAFEINRVEVVGGDGALALSQWQVADGNPRRLIVHLKAPMSGPLQLRFHGVPRGSLVAETVSLRLPTPLRSRPVESVLAYRLEGREVTDKTKNLSVTGLAADKFNDAWARTGMSVPVAPTRAYSFSRAGASASLELALQPFKPRVQLDLDWHVQPDGARLRLHSAWSSAADLTRVDFALPAGLTILAADGPNLHHWNAHERTLQIWLEKPGKKATFTVQAVLNGSPKERRFKLPQIAAPQALAADTKIAVHPTSGWTIAPERLLHLMPLGQGTELRYQARQPDFQGVFVLSPPSVAPVFQGLISAQPRGSQVHVAAALVATLAYGDLPTLKVHLRDWAASAPRLELSTPALRQDHQQAGADHVWTLQFPAGHPRVVFIKLHGEATASQPLDLPRVAIEGGKLTDLHVAWPAAGLAARRTQGLKEIKAADADDRLKALGMSTPRHALSLWLVEQAEWHCTLAAPASWGTHAGQVVFAQQFAIPAGAGRWLHQADWLLVARELNELTARLPEGALLVDVRVNQQIVPIRAAAHGVATIPLPAPAGVFHVRALWRYADATEDPTRPRLHSPVLDDVESAGVHGVVYAPAGAVWSGRAGGIPMPEQPMLTAFAQACAKVIALGQKSQTPEARAALVHPWRQQLQQVMRHLEYQALLQRDDRARAAVAELRKQLQEALRGNTSSPPDKTPPAWSVPRPDDGLPIYWTGVPPALRLQPGSAAGPAPWWSRETLVLAMLGIFLLSWLPRGLSWFVRLWPEQLLGLAALGYACWGPSAVMFALICVAVLGRLVLSLAWVRRLFLARAAPPAAPFQL